MRKILLFLLIAFSLGFAYSEIKERGVVKEYKGKSDKTALPGVELMVQGAQSTVSNPDGSFTLEFKLLQPGDKVVYTEIYKKGYVIFNKDALDAWRISKNQRPFTIVMCKEEDFRALKKKFYGIIEKSYYNEYLRQKELAEKMIADNLKKAQKLEDLQKEYEEKMSNINTYVELFSRIDLNEMDSIESKALVYIEAGEIDNAIRTYEELQLKHEMETQFSKWDAAVEMRMAANGMESEAQADLISLVDKMQKQISLYQMGGYDYNVKRIEMTDNLIALLYRLRPVAGTQYDELLGELIVTRAKAKPLKEHLTDYKRAAALPSVAGLIVLAEQYETLNPSEERLDTIRKMYCRAIDMIANPEDSLSIVLSKKLRNIPEGFYRNGDGTVYGYRLLPGNEAVLMGRGPYFSTHLEGEVVLPDAIVVNDTLRTVTEIGEFAFGNNKSLRKVTLPRHCRRIGKAAFYGCKDMTMEVNPELKYVHWVFPSMSVPLSVNMEFPETPLHAEWILRRVSVLDNDNAGDDRLFPYYRALSRYYQAQNDRNNAITGYGWIVEYLIGKGECDMAREYAALLGKTYKKDSERMLGFICMKEGNPEQAIKHGEKALDDENPYTYNMLANYLIDARVKKPNYDKAHKMIDKAISLTADSLERAAYLDTKGTIYLKQGNEEKARECLDLALDQNRDYIVNRKTDLFIHFYPSEDSGSSMQGAEKDIESERPLSQEEIAEREQKDLNRRRLQNWVDVVQRCARIEYKNIPDTENFRSAEYEELVSIGILAVQVLIKNKTPEELEKYNVAYVSTAVRWAIRNELKIRYPWYHLVYNTYDTDFAQPIYERQREYERLGIDYQKSMVRISVYKTIAELANAYDDDGPDAFEKITDRVDRKDSELMQMWDVIQASRKDLPEKYIECYDSFFAKDADYAEFENKFSPDLINGMFNEIKEHVTKSSLIGF